MSSSSSATPEPLDPNFRLELQGFEGPLDLLLHLCQKHELDVLNLPIAFVTESYLSYIRLMEKLDLDIASEYLVMAATLAHIKSKMLLPADPAAQHDDVDPEDEVDPRQELIRRLLEYQKYKAAGEELGARGVQGRDVFLRGMEAPEASGPPPLAGMGLFKLLDAFQAVLKRAKQDLAFEITAEGVTIQDRMTQLAEKLRLKRRCTFDELFVDVKSVYDVVVTFLAILEMAKRRLARVYQSDPLAPIHLEYRVLDADEMAEGGPDSEGAAAQTYDDPVPAAVEGASAPTEIEPPTTSADGVMDEARSVGDEAEANPDDDDEDEDDEDDDDDDDEDDDDDDDDDDTEAEADADSDISPDDTAEVATDSSLDASEPTASSAELDPSTSEPTFSDDELEPSPPIEGDGDEPLDATPSDADIATPDEALEPSPPPIDESETLPEDRETEPGVALETELEPPSDGALEGPLAPEVDEALEAPIEPDEAALDLGDALAQDPRPSETDDPEPHS